MADLTNRRAKGAKALYRVIVLRMGRDWSILNTALPRLRCTISQSIVARACRQAVKSKRPARTRGLVMGENPHGRCRKAYKFPPRADQADALRRRRLPDHLATFPYPVQHPGCPVRPG